MERGRTILAAVDFSAAAERAFERGVALAAKLDAELVLVHAWNPTSWLAEPDLAEAGQTWLDSAREFAERQLETWAERGRQAGCRVRTRIELGVPSRVLADLALSLGVDLVVVGRRGRARLAHVIVGSVSERIVRLGACPVLVVPEEAPTTPLVPRRLLVGIDFSEASREALDVAAGLVADRGAQELVLVHAQPDERELWLESGADLAGERGWPYDQSALDTWAKPLRRRGIAIEARLVKGRTETVLVELAKSAPCDWIVVGVQGRTALAALLMGSTTGRVLELADRPVLAVPLRGGSSGEATA